MFCTTHLKLVQNWSLGYNIVPQKMQHLNTLYTIKVKNEPSMIPPQFCTLISDIAIVFYYIF